MSSIYDKYLNMGVTVPHSNFPLSEKNYCTMPFGKLIPFYARETTFGDKVKITPKAFFRSLPMKFPLLNSLRLHVAYFYCRDRQVYEHFEDFVTQTGTWNPKHATDSYPVLAYTEEQRQKMFGPNGIATSLGIPVTVPPTLAGSFSRYNVLKDSRGVSSSCGSPLNAHVSFTVPVSIQNSIGDLIRDSYRPINLLKQFTEAVTSIGDVALRDTLFPQVVSNSSVAAYLRGLSDSRKCFTAFRFKFSPITLHKDDDLLNYDGNISAYRFFNDFAVKKGTFRNCDVHVGDCSMNPIQAHNGANPGYVAFCDNHDLIVAYGSLAEVDGNFKISKLFAHTKNASSADVYDFEGLTIDHLILFSNAPVTAVDTNVYSLVLTFNNYAYSIEDPLVGNYFSWKPYIEMCIPDVATDLTKALKDVYKPENLALSAMPFRHYQRICNTFYRNEKNNPFMLDGYPEYNRYNTTLKGGQDSTVYSLESAPWMHDIFTTCLPSPTGDIDNPLVPIVDKQGNMSAPVNRTLNVRFTDKDGNLITATSELNAKSGKLKELKLTSSRNDDLAKSVKDEYATITKDIYDGAQSGINIATFGDISALERYIEFRFRNGLHYQDFVNGQFGVQVKFAEYKLPQYIGGFTKNISTIAVDNEALSAESPLGELGAYAQIGAEGKTFTHWCDERGWIIGIAYIDVEPVYGDVLSPQFTRTSQLDFYLPQFSNIQMQPIRNSFISPLAAFAQDGKKGLDTIFGYQRPHADYVGSFSRTSRSMCATQQPGQIDYSNFVMSRRFATPPELGYDFLRLDVDQVNHSFIDTSSSDKFIGVFETDVVAKRPIPLSGLPKIV